jgi:hypothetical protein
VGRRRGPAVLLTFEELGQRRGQLQARLHPRVERAAGAAGCELQRLKKRLMHPEPVRLVALIRAQDHLESPLCRASLQKRATFRVKQIDHEIEANAASVFSERGERVGHWTLKKAHTALHRFKLGQGEWLGGRDEARQYGFLRAAANVGGEIKATEGGIPAGRD